MLTDIEIAQKCKLIPIEKIAKSIGLYHDEYELYGKFSAKINLSAYEKRKDKKDGNLILITTINPTPFGEGKTTTAIGLAQAFKKIRKKSFVCIREPSLGPTMGIKGGAAGGGYSQVLPMEDINLHFTGDMHTVGAAHNLLAAMIDNHIYFGNEFNFDLDNIAWNRVIDMNDRALRNIVLKYKDVERQASFDITAASEVMAILCLSMNIQDLKEKISKIICGYSVSGNPITAKDLKADGAMALLLKEAILPNLVQTIEGVPAFVHGGPFANIAHGCNSLIATKLALKLSDYVVVEAGFGSDLGAEKFFDIKCRIGDLNPQAAILVVTAKALKWQGGISKEEIKNENLEALQNGIENLKAHIKALSNFGIPIIVNINKFAGDEGKEIDLIIKNLEIFKVRYAVSDVREKGGEGAVDLAKKVVKLLKEDGDKFNFLYENSESIKEKITKIARNIYGADDAVFTENAAKELDKTNELGFSNLPICVAKTQFSLSDDHTKLGRPKGFNLTIKKLKICAGAGFIVAYAGDIMTIPGLPKHPAAENMDIDNDGNIRGIF